MDASALMMLAESGASAIVAAMATDAWNKVRESTVAWFGGDDSSQRDAADADLENARQVVVTAYAEGRMEVVRDVKSELKGELKARLRNDEQRIEAFEALVAEIQKVAPVSSTTNTFNQSAVADRGGSVVQAGNDVYGTPPARRNRR